MNTTDTILSRTTRAERLVQLAEECAELGKAALKVRRTITRDNPTPVSCNEAEEQMREEIADVLLMMQYVTGGDVAITASPDIVEIAERKERRWAKRLRHRK